MAKNKIPLFTCQICGKSFPQRQLFHGNLVRDSILAEIIKKHPLWDSSGYICNTDLDRFRHEHITTLLREEVGALSKLDEEVLASYKNNELVTEDVNKQIKASRTFAEILSDKFASFLGSWTFIISFGFILILYVCLNIGLFFQSTFDPFPFILLNLILSSLAAFQAPIILMSQNRQSKRDRVKFDYEYMINLKAELEIQHINAKIDELMRSQWKRLMEMENIQVELMEEIKKKM